MTKRTIHLLYAGVHKEDQKLIKKNGQFHLVCVDNLEKCLKALKKKTLDCLLIESSLLQEDLAFLREMHVHEPQIPVIVLTPKEDDFLARKVLRAGAQDFLSRKDFSKAVLSKTILHAMARTQAEEETRSLAKFPAENPNPILKVDVKGTILYMNRAGLKLIQDFGKEMNTLLTHQWRKELASIQKTKTGKELEANLGGRVFQFLASPAGENPTIFFYGADVTERRQSEKLKEDLLSTVSHEIRSPLAVIHGAVSNLRDGIVGPLTEKQKEVVEMASGHIGRLNRLIKDLLDLSRLESGHTKIHRLRVEVVALIQEVVQHFHPQSGDRKIVPQISLPTLLPDIYVDPDMIHQVMNNLLENAARFAKSSIRIEIKTVDQDFVRISVIDDGVGVAPELHEVIFEKFRQVGRAQGKGYKGTGLGLAISKEIVDHNDGRIWVESTPGKGSSFHFTLPIFKEERDFWLFLQSAMQEASERKIPLAVMGLKISNMQALKNKHSIKEIDKMMEDLPKWIQHNVLRKSDQLFSYPLNGETLKDSYLLVLQEAGRPEADIVYQRLRQKLEDGSQKDVQFDFRLALYPEDADSPKKLLEKIKCCQN